MHLQGKEICILGLGKTGQSCIPFLQQKGAILTLMDTRTHLNTASLPQGLPLYLGLNLEVLKKMDLIVASPGIALSTPELVEARKAGVAIIGDIELFCHFVDKPILAITGSNGKSTVTSLVAEMGRCSGLKVGMGGNIGIPALSLLDQNCDLYVLELSSFQLETTFSLKAQGATVLNISEDHLNRYRDLEAYRQAKLNIYRHTEVAVINGDDPLTFDNRLATEIGKIVQFSACNSDYCIQTFEGKRYLMALGKQVLACDEMGITGKHNEMNALSAIALAQSVPLPMEGIRQGLRQYKGLDHRFQCVHQANGVRWINDSKATNVGSTLAALTGLSLHRGRLHLLLGGDGKAADFSPLQPLLQNKAIFCYCFGKDGETLSRLSSQSQLFDTMAEAITEIKKRVQKNDTVLLSPACASLDQFKSFEERGEIFTCLVRAG